MIFLAIMLVAYASLDELGQQTNSPQSPRATNLSERRRRSRPRNRCWAAMMRDFDNQCAQFGRVLCRRNQSSQPGQLRPGRSSFSDTNGTANATSVTAIGGTKGWSALPARYNGLYGWGQISRISLPDRHPAKHRRQPLGHGGSAGVVRHHPIFQYAIFYNMDLEINSGAAMTINGKVHSNDTIWATGSGASTPLTFSNMVDYATGRLQRHPQHE